MFNRIEGIVVSLLLHVACAGLCATETKADAPTEQPKRSWVDLGRYAGQSGGAPITQTDYRQLVLELQSQRSTMKAAKGLSPAQRLPYATLSTPRNNLRERVPLSVLHWNRTVEQLTPEQKEQALATGVAPKPVTTNVSVFAISPVRPTTYRGASLRFVVEPEVYFEETSELTSPVLSLKLDAGDGGGWQALKVGQEVTASYNSTGSKTLQMEAVLTNGVVLAASALLEVVALTSPDPTETVALNGGSLYLYKSGAHAGLRCPVLVVEGFDMMNDMGWDELYATLNTKQLAETLGAYGRDLAVLDFADATDDILSMNASVAIDAINHINSQRSDLSDKFTVIGASMGGLVSRIALVKMDTYAAVYGQSHVSSWISFDSPQEGANIPLSLQEMFAFFGSLSTMSSSYSSLAVFEEYRKAVDSPAAQQMLLCHHLSTPQMAAPSPNYSSFYPILRTYGYPTRCKKVAVCNGSMYATQQAFQAGEMVLKWYYRDYWRVDIDAHVYALAKSSNTPSLLFYGHFNPFDLGNSADYFKSTNRFYPFALDNMSGGTRASFAQLRDNIEKSGFWQNGSYCKSDTHCFIPTTSALGIPQEHMEKALDANPEVMALSPFDEVYCAVINEPHIEINSRNKGWFLKAVLENYDTDGDGLDDYQESILGTDYASTNKIEFTTSSVVATGEGNAGSGVYTATAAVFGFGPSSVNVYIMPGTAGAQDYSAPASPVTLSWAVGEAGTKTITIPIRGDRFIEGAEVFYMVLDSAFSDRIGLASICTVTIPDDDTGVTPNRGILVMGLPLPPQGGSAMGAKYCLPGRAVTLTARAASGWTFLNWEGGAQSTTHSVSYEEAVERAHDGVMCSRAIFKKTSSLVPPVVNNPGPQSATVGVAFRLRLSILSESLPTIAVRGLPSGLMFDSKTCSVVGAPIRTGVFTVTVTAQNPKGSASPQTFTLAVDALPSWAQGTFNGSVQTEALGSGPATMTVSSQGSVSGKITLRGTNFGFSARSYMTCEETSSLALIATASVGRATIPLSLRVYVPETDEELSIPDALSVAAGDTEDNTFITMYRSIWKDADGAGLGTNYVGYYTAHFSGDDLIGTSYLTFTIDRFGSVRTVGKLADGTPVSTSGSLILDEAGNVFTVLYTSPSNYRGGGLFGLVQFVQDECAIKPLLGLLNGSSLLWQSFNPMATSTHGYGFSRESDLSGGWYDTLGNLYDYYRGKTLSVDLNDAATPPSLMVGTNRYEAVCWNPTGLLLFAVTNQAGVMTGITAPKAQYPTDSDLDQAWNYSATNTMRLSISLTRATGIFRGSTYAWFDYAASLSTTIHTARYLTYEGVLTPERSCLSEAVTGCGFLLWTDWSHFVSFTGRATPYSFNRSCDFLIRVTGSEDEP